MHAQLAGLHKRFGAKLVVDDVSLDIADGEFLVILGPSGCGKTTTLRLLAGLETPDGGTIAIGDRVVSDPARNVSVPPNDRNVGMVFQSYAIWPHLTVFQNVAYPLKLRRESRAEIERRVGNALQLVGLEADAQRSATALSGGQMQRVALARAIVYDPALLLFDEPLSNLDLKLRERLRVELKQLQQRTGLTSVYVTHDQTEAVELGDRIVVMNAGRIVQIATPAELFRRPKTRFVAEFIGTANIVQGTVENAGAAGTAAVRLAGGQTIAVQTDLAVSAGETVDVVIHPEGLRVDRTGKCCGERARNGSTVPRRIDALHGRLERHAAGRRRARYGGRRSRCGRGRSAGDSSRHGSHRVAGVNVRRTLPGRLTVGALLAIAAVLIVLPVGVLLLGSFLIEPPRALHVDWSGPHAAQLRERAVRPVVRVAPHAVAGRRIHRHGGGARRGHRTRVARRALRRSGPAHLGSRGRHAPLRLSPDRRVRVEILGSPRSGILNIAARQMHLPGLINVYTFGGICFVFAIYYAPYVFLFAAAALRNMDPVLEEAAAMCGASKFRSLFDVTLPLITPALASSALLVFVLLVELFSIPAVLGRAATSISSPCRFGICWASRRRA